MRWRSKSDPALVKAVISAFSAPAEKTALQLLAYGEKDWAGTEFWLDVSGLALYFLDHLQSENIAASLAPHLHRKIEQNHANNRTRTQLLFEEFVVLNRLFQDDGIRYANLKGFTLQPDSCPDMSLRHQSDYDFLVHPSDLEVGRSLLEKRGYRITGSTRRTLEFKSGHVQKISLNDHYKLKSLTVELHIALDGLGVNKQLGCDERLTRLREWKCDEGVFPALSSADQWISQALHLLGHLRGEHTRPSWFLEFRLHAIAKKDDEKFWKEVKALAGNDQYTTIAIGLSILLAEDLFGVFSSEKLRSWTVDPLPGHVRLWAMTYGRRAVLSDVPGTKLYLLLEDAIGSAAPESEQTNARRFIPLRLPPRILQAPAQDNVRLRIRRDLIQLRFILYRFRFHMEQNFLYLIELRHWKKLVRNNDSMNHHVDGAPMMVSSLHDTARNTGDIS